MKKLSIVLAVAAVVLAACGEKTPVEIIQTVDWYKANEVERTSMIEKCKNNPGELAASPNCINAITAANHLVFDNRNYKNRAKINAFEGDK